MAHTDEIPRSSKCRLLRVDRKWLTYGQNDATGEQALEAAQHYGGRQNEARARLSLASLYIQRGEADRGLGFVDQALTFYQAGGYRTETSQALLLRGRIYKQKGDYKSALQSFQDQLQLAEQIGGDLSPCVPASLKICKPLRPSAFIRLLHSLILKRATCPICPRLQ